MTMDYTIEDLHRALANLCEVYGFELDRIESTPEVTRDVIDVRMKITKRVRVEGPRDPGIVEVEIIDEEIEGERKELTA